jgi:hypothetical protein
VIPLPPKKPQVHPLIARILVVKNQIDRLECQQDCQTFIERHVKIEDLDTPGIVMPFTLWPGQVRALAAFLLHRLVLVLKARQLGLTWLALAYAAWRLVFTVGYRVVALSANEDKAKELVRRLVYILEHLPPHIIRPKKGADPRWAGPTWEATTLSITVYHPGGEPAMLQGLPATPGAGRMFTASLVLIDEWAEQESAREIWTGAFPIVNRPGGGQVIGLSTMVLGTLFDELSLGAEAGTNDFHEVFLDRWTDPRRDQEWFERTKRAMPNTWQSEYPETPAEARSVGTGAFFWEWQERIHVPIDHWEPPRSAAWPIIGVYDPAYNQACFKWYTISPGAPGFPRGWARCFREYTPKHVTAYDQAREILRLSCYHDGKATTVKDPYPDAQHKEVEIPGTPFVFKRIIADTRAWNRDDTGGISTEEIFRKYGLFMRQANKDVEAGWMELHEWLKPRLDPDAPPGEERLTAKLTFTRDCRMTIATYPACVASKSTPEDISNKTPSDPQDCDRYFCMSRVKAVEEKPDPLAALAEIHKPWSAGYRVLAAELQREDPKNEVELEDLGM